MKLLIKPVKFISGACYCRNDCNSNCGSYGKHSFCWRDESSGCAQKNFC